MNKNKKISLLVIGILLLLSIVVGISYALYQINLTQSGTNTAFSGCFEVTSDLGTPLENDAIQLDNIIPVTDSDGMNLKPFTFTLRNTCNMTANYQINLETMSTTTLGLEYVKAVIDNNTPKVLSEYDVVETTITNATSSNKLLTGVLDTGTSQTFNLRIWLDEDTTEEQAENKSYVGKISVISTSGTYSPRGVDTIMNLVRGEDNTTLGVITKEAPSGDSCTYTFGYDNTADNNLRYVGANPCNYVYFNCSTTNPSEMSSSTCEVWRIIGLMNNVDDGTGKKETRLKIIRRDSLGSYSWDTSTQTATDGDPAVNYGYGINQWGPSTNYTTGLEYPGADLMQELNGDYLDLTLTENTTWYNGRGNAKTATFDYTKRLKESAQNLIGNAVWYTGTYNDTSVGNSNVTTPISYQNERSTNPSANASYHGKYCSSGTSCNDSIERTYQWTGKVGLQYPSDMGYATLGSTSMEEYTREKCINEVLISSGNYNSSTYGSCGSSSWLRNLAGWSLSPYAYASYARYVGHVDSAGNVLNFAAYGTRSARPAVYLQSSVKISGGNGTLSTPYTLGN